MQRRIVLTSHSTLGRKHLHSVSKVWYNKVRLHKVANYKTGGYTMHITTFYDTQIVFSLTKSRGLKYLQRLMGKQWVHDVNTVGDDITGAYYIVSFTSPLREIIWAYQVLRNKYP